jgi:flagellar basal-body rod protein FlgB
MGMSIDFDKALGVHGQALALRAERTRVLAANLANEDTPGYQARDIDFAASMREAHAGSSPGPGAPSGLQAVDAMLADVGEGSASALYRVPFHPSQDGNTVELGVEQAAFSQNASDFQMSLTFLDMQLKGLAKAISGQ